MNTSIAFIGGGNMAASLIGGLLASGVAPENILVAEPDAGKCEQLRSQFAIKTTLSNHDTLQSDIVVLAVKPQILQPVCRELASSNDTPHKPLFISIAAGVRCSDIDRWLGNDNAIVRCMPNTPSLFQAGATALYANDRVSESQKTVAGEIMQSVGIALWVDDEQQLDAVTALSGSGPAYYFLLMEAMQAAGEKLGLDAKIAQQLTLQTALGAALMANKSHIDTATLRSNVTSKGGTTERAIRSFEDSGFRESVANALQAAYERSQSLADELGKDQ